MAFLQCVCLNTGQFWVRWVYIECWGHQNRQPVRQCTLTWTWTSPFSCPLSPLTMNTHTCTLPQLYVHVCMYDCIIIATYLPVWLDMGKSSWFQNGSITQKGKLGSSGREGARDINMITCSYACRAQPNIVQSSCIYFAYQGTGDTYSWCSMT